MLPKLRFFPIVAFPAQQADFAVSPTEAHTHAVNERGGGEWVHLFLLHNLVKIIANKVLYFGGCAGFKLGFRP